MRRRLHEAAGVLSHFLFAQLSPTLGHPPGGRP
jgi:hypothetical protein